MQAMTAELRYIPVEQAAKEKNVDGSELVKLIRRKIRLSELVRVSQTNAHGVGSRVRNRGRDHGRKGAFSIDLSSCLG
jgi:hypothetical protein